MTDLRPPINNLVQPSNAVEGRLRLETKRWFFQLLVSLFVVPYIYFSMAVLGAIVLLAQGLLQMIGVSLNLEGQLEPSDFREALIAFFWLGSYWFLSARVHAVADWKLTFTRSWWRSPRPYVAGLVIACCAFLGRWLEINANSPEPYREWTSRVWFLGLFLSSVLATWVISEWYCRFRRRSPQRPPPDGSRV